MPLTDGHSCRCKNPKCNVFHNNVNGNGYCKKCMRIRRLFGGIKTKKLEGVMLPR